MADRLTSRRTLGKLDDVSLHHLLKFLAVVETGSQQGAARELGCSSANISVMMDSLNNLFGVQLFERGHPTDSARKIVPIIRQIVALAGRVERISNPNKIHVAFTRSFTGAMSYVFEKLIAIFKQQGLEFTISTGTSDQIVRQVADGEIDVGIVIREALINYPIRGIEPEFAVEKGKFAQRSASKKAQVRWTSSSIRIESAIRKEATEILLIPVQELDMVRMDFGRLHCYYRQPEITRAQFAYLAIYFVLIGNVAAEEARIERLFRGSDERLYNLQFEKMRLPDSEPAVVIYIEPVRPANGRQRAAEKKIDANH